MIKSYTALQKKRLVKSIVKLRNELLTIKELHWFFKINKHVNFKDFPVENIESRDVDKVIGSFSIIMLFRLFENYFSNKNKVWEQFMDPYDFELFMAYNVVRHSVTHGYRSGGMKISRKNKTQIPYFDSVIKIGGFKPQGIIDYDPHSDSVIIHSTIGIHLSDFMYNLLGRVISNINSPNA